MELVCYKILEYLYIGSNTILEENPDNISFHFLVNCTVDIPFPKNAVYPMQMRIPIENTIEDSFKFYNMIIYTKVLEKIAKCIHDKKNVFVYSSNKLERPFSLLSCFLIKYFKLTPTDAMKFIQNKYDTEILENNHFKSTINCYYCICKQTNKNNNIDKNEKIEENNNKILIPKLL